MKRYVLSILLSLYLCTQLCCQSTDSNEITLKTVQLIEPRSIALNGGMRASFGGVSRTYIKIDLPQNTVKWYYSFTTSSGENGSHYLNLMGQLSALILDPTHLSTTLTNVKVPTGTNSLAVYLCDGTNIKKFLDKVDLYDGSYNYIMEGSVENTKQAKVEINDVRLGTWFLAIKNPSTFNGVNVWIEVVAIVEE